MSRHQADTEEGCELWILEGLFGSDTSYTDLCTYDLEHGVVALAKCAPHSEFDPWHDVRLRNLQTGEVIPLEAVCSEEIG